MEENDKHTNGFMDMGNDRMRFEIKRALLEDSPTPDVRQAYQEFLERNQLKARRKPTLWISIISIAAAACIALLLFNPWKQQDKLKQALQRPNKELAMMGNVVYQASEKRQYITLSLGDRTVDLTDQASAKDAGITITKDNIIRIFDHLTDNHEDMTISVPAGKTAKIVLDDGTKVSLNAGSLLTFPHHFRESGVREVKLFGEAYFEVNHDETRPFIVNADGLRTKVLGTKFNVKSFKDETCRVSLTEGSVEVSHASNKIYLKPEETATLKGETLEVSPTDNDLALGWLHGEFYFDGQTLKEIMTEIGRWYNLNVVFANDSHLDEQLHFSANRTAPINEIVRQLQLIGNACIELKNQEQVLLIK